MFGVLRAQECALVMIEPPGEARVGGIFKIDDGIFIAIKERVVKKLLGFVSQAGVDELRVTREILFIESAEERSGRGSVEAVIVI